MPQRDRWLLAPRMDPRAAISFSPANVRDSARDYILDMIEQLAAMAHRAGEVELAIHLKAILDARRAAERRRTV